MAAAWWEAVRKQNAETVEVRPASAPGVVLAPLAAVSAPSPNDLWHTDGYDWHALANCETGSDWSMHGGVYSTAFGIMNGAQEMTPAARNGTATPEQQLAIAIAVERRAGIRAWGCHASAGG